MSIKLDDLELSKRIGDSGYEAPLKELRNVYCINIVDKRSVVELEVPGSDGNVMQDMGCEPVQISLFGEMMGKEVKKGLEMLKQKFETNKPFQFSSDISSVAEVSQVLMEELYLEQVAGSINRYKYRIALREYVEPKREQQVKQLPRTEQPLVAKRMVDVVAQVQQSREALQTTAQSAAQSLSFSSPTSNRTCTSCSK